MHGQKNIKLCNAGLIRIVVLDGLRLSVFYITKQVKFYKNINKF